MADENKDILKIPVGISIDKDNIDRTISSLEERLSSALYRISNNSVATTNDSFIAINHSVQSIVDNISRQRNSLIAKFKLTNLDFINAETQKKALDSLTTEYLKYFKSVKDSEISPFVNTKVDLESIMPSVITLSKELQGIKINDKSFKGVTKSIDSLVDKLQNKLSASAYSINIEEILPELNKLTSEYLDVSANKISNIEKRLSFISATQNVVEKTKSIYKDIPILSGLLTVALGPFGNLITRKLAPLFGIDKLFGKIFGTSNEKKKLEDTLSNEIKLRESLNKSLISMLQGIDENVNLNKTRNVAEGVKPEENNGITKEEPTTNIFNGIKMGLTNGFDKIKNFAFIKESIGVFSEIKSGISKSVSFLKTISFASLLQIIKFLAVGTALGSIGIGIKKGVDVLKAINNKNKANDTYNKAYKDTMSNLSKKLAENTAIVKDSNSTDTQKKRAEQQIQVIKKSMNTLAAENKKMMPTINNYSNTGRYNPQIIPRKANGGSILETGNVIIHKGEEIIPAKVSNNGALLNTLQNLSTGLSNNSSKVENKINVNTDLSQLNSSFYSLSSSLKSLSAKEEMQNMVTLLNEINKKLELLISTNNTKEIGKNSFNTPIRNLNT